jgi:ketosteroid isomerase-like protein
VSQEQANLDLVRRYYAAMQAGPSGGELAAFYAQDAIQEEFPNQFLPRGARRDLAAIREAAERGRHAVSAQTFEIVHAVASGDTVAVEARWSGTLAIAAGPIAAGTVMRARYAQFFELRDGKILWQRNYDCFDPW